MFLSLSECSLLLIRTGLYTSPCAPVRTTVGRGDSSTYVHSPQVAHVTCVTLTTTFLELVLPCFHLKIYLCSYRCTCTFESPCIYNIYIYISIYMCVCVCVLFSISLLYVAIQMLLSGRLYGDPPPLSTCAIQFCFIVKVYNTY
jgi:hypothetical protein